MPLEDLLWSALLGWGVGQDREEIAALPLTYANGRATRWSEVVRTFAQMYRGGRAGEAYLVGAFLAYCVTHRLLDGEEYRRALEREVAEIRRTGRERSAVLARGRLRVVKPSRDPQRGSA